MMRILWLAPNFNHYKARFLNHLAKDESINLTIMSGSGRQKMGDKNLKGEWSFNILKIDVPKKDFGKSKLVQKELKSIFNNFDWVLIPAEKKNLPLFLYAMKLRKSNRTTRLFSYNHAQLKSNNSIYSFLDSSLTKFFNSNLDRVVFYTEQAQKKAVNSNLIIKEKAYWANNTIDTIEVKKHYDFTFPPIEAPSILFIGRLIPSKRVGDLILYYKRLLTIHPNLKLEIIGDGPQKDIVKDAVDENQNIVWHGAIIDEEIISPIMKRNCLIFIPGLSGLSINHAFAYGRPYITLSADKHGPEISYLKDGKNGYILNGSSKENIDKISDLLSDKEKLKNFCLNAMSEGKDLTVEKWVEQIKNSLLHEL